MDDYRKDILDNTCSKTNQEIKINIKSGDIDEKSNDNKLVRTYLNLSYNLFLQYNSTNKKESYTVISFDSLNLTDTNSSVSPSFSNSKQIKQDPYTRYSRGVIKKANRISQLSCAEKYKTEE